MKTWWFYELQSAQAALDAWQAIEQSYQGGELTGLTFYSREGRDRLDHLYVAVCTKIQTPGHAESVEYVLGRFGHRVGFVRYEFKETAGLHFDASGDAETIIAGLRWQDPAEIAVESPPGGQSAELDHSAWWRPGSRRR